MFDPRKTGVMLASLFVAFTASADGLNRCQKTINTLTAGHERATSGLERRHIGAIESQIKRLRQQQLDPEVTRLIEQSIERIRRNANPAAAREAFVTNVVRDMEVLRDQASDASKCPARSLMETILRGNEFQYGKVLRAIEDEVEKRVDIADLADDEGLVVLAISGSEDFDFIRIDKLDGRGAMIVENTTAGEYFRILKAKAGDYVWDQMYQDRVTFKRKWTIRDREYVFSVEPGILNLAGVLSVERTGDNYTDIVFSNRVVIILSKMEDEYPELLDLYDVRNGVDGGDPFLSFYLKERREIANAGM